MCGIVGFIGGQEAAPILLEGLARLEYRGYDSAGLAVLDPAKGLQVVKAKGRLKVLSGLVDGAKRCPAPWAWDTPAGPPTGSRQM